MKKILVKDFINVFKNTQYFFMFVVQPIFKKYGSDKENLEIEDAKNLFVLRVSLEPHPQKNMLTLVFLVGDEKDFKKINTGKLDWIR